MSGITFSDRYGGNYPSGLTDCYACEAMGWYPTNDSAEWPAGAEPDEIGFVFVRCQACHGTGRIPLRRGLMRLPGLWLKGARFVWHSRTFGVPPGWSRFAWFLHRLRIAFLNDLLLLSKRTRRWAVR
jgi:hypothetical protein